MYPDYLFRQQARYWKMCCRTLGSGVERKSILLYIFASLQKLAKAAQKQAQTAQKLVLAGKGSKEAGKDYLEAGPLKLELLKSLPKSSQR